MNEIQRNTRMPLDLGKWNIRSWVEADIESLVRYANNRHVSINLRDSFPYPYTEQNASRWIRSVRHQVPESSFAIASATEAIGGIGIHIQHDVYRRSAEIGYWLGEPFWGKGIATRAVSAMTEYAFARYDLVRIFAGVFEWNPASVRVLEKAGFVLEGRQRKSVFKDGTIIDQLLYAIVRE